MNERDIVEYNRLMNDGFKQSDEPDELGYYLVPKYDFKKMCKRFGRAYIRYMKDSWYGMSEFGGTEDEYMKVYQVPQDFFIKHIK